MTIIKQIAIKQITRNKPECWGSSSSDSEVLSSPEVLWRKYVNDRYSQHPLPKKSQDEQLALSSHFFLPIKTPLHNASHSQLKYKEREKKKRKAGKHRWGERLAFHFI